MKLSKELSKRATGRTLYILDEPTTGLHFEDVRKLMEVIQELSNSGNTVIVIEHNLDVIKQADWVIDLGPEGGDGGGEIVACGTPEEVAKVRAGYTGKFLKGVLLKSKPAKSTGTKASAAPRTPAPKKAVKKAPAKKKAAKPKPKTKTVADSSDAAPKRKTNKRTKKRAARSTRAFTRAGTNTSSRRKSS